MDKTTQNARIFEKVFFSEATYNTYKLVGALSPVNRKGLHQGWTQTSLYHQLS